MEKIQIIENNNLITERQFLPLAKDQWVSLSKIL